MKLGGEWGNGPERLWMGVDLVDPAPIPSSITSNPFLSFQISIGKIERVWSNRSHPLLPTGYNMHQPGEGERIDLGS